MWRVIIVTCVLIFAGCANQQQPQHAQTESSAARVALDDTPLHSLIAARDRVGGEIEELDRQLADLRRQNPNLDDTRDVAKQRLLQISQALTAAELAVIDIRSNHAEGHPSVAAAQRRESEIRKLYDEALAQLGHVNNPGADRDRLTAELSHKQDLLKQLNERIRLLELRS